MIVRERGDFALQKPQPTRLASPICSERHPIHFPPGLRDRTGTIVFIIDRLLAAISHPTRVEWQRQIRAHVGPMVTPWGHRISLPADFATHPLWT